MRFTHESTVTVDGSPYNVNTEWSDLSTLPQLLSHVRATAIAGEQDMGRMVVMLDGSHIEFVVQRTMCSDDTVCWQNVGSDFEYILTITIKPHARGANLTVNCSYDPPGILPDLIETLGFGHTFRHDLDRDLDRYRQSFERREYVQGEGTPSGPLPAYGLAD